MAARMIGAALLGCVLLIEAAAAMTDDPTDRLEPLPAGATTVGGEIGRRIEVTIAENLLQLDVECDFLEPFRSRNHRSGFIGLGMFIDGLVSMAAHTGDPRVVELKDRTVAAAIAAQQPDGYLGVMLPESRTWRMWDTHESAYVIHGLTSDFAFGGDRRSLAAAERLAAFVIAQLRTHPGRDLGDGTVSNDTATTGLDLALLRLADCTGNATYREFAVVDRRLPAWDLPIVTGRWGLVDGHAYAFIDHALAQAHLGRTDPRSAGNADAGRRQVRRAVEFLLRGEGLAITGGCGDHECWHDSQQGTANLGETCATGCILRLMDDCLRHEGDGRFGDVMERAIHNALFAAQSPDGRRIRYYTPFDGPRRYFDKDTYCCPCNYRRIVAELPGFVWYRRGPAGLVVNLFTDSRTRLDVAGVGLAVRQETDYPNSGRVLMHVDPARPLEFTLHLRIPRWCRGATVRVNDAAVEPTRPGADGFHTLSRRWQAGDRVALDMPMPWRLVKGRVAQSGRVAVMRGPRLFCLSRSGIEPTAGPAAALRDSDLRLLTIKPESIEGPFPDDSVRPGGIACRIAAWSPGVFYPEPNAEPDLRLTLREFIDPAGEAVFFNVPNPHDPHFVDDECLEPGGPR